MIIAKVATPAEVLLDILGRSDTFGDLRSAISLVFTSRGHYLKGNSEAMDDFVEPVSMDVYFIDGDVQHYFCDPEFEYKIIKHICEKWQGQILAIKWNGVFISDEIIKSYI